jgi:hypothetical protein
VLNGPAFALGVGVCGKIYYQAASVDDKVEQDRSEEERVGREVREVAMGLEVV